ncbi:diaminopimelate decarboxylase [Niveispirillum fermenti]|uniref:diaminopimelate decarboxylase n=1 Tax=Niveispirillum fermenti TaxID=1233113 RepID=UPI003A856E5F
MTCFPVPGFHYVQGRLHAEGVALEAIAAAVGTPTYVYTTEGLTAAWRAYADAFAGQDVDICYALKANSNLAVIRTLATLGAGGDVVSVGEMRRALAAGIPAGKIVFSGVGKTKAELAAALTAGIHQINVESLPELDALSAVAVELGIDAPIAIRINPDVDAETHGKINTGRKEDKFGIDFAHAGEAYARALSLPGLKPLGIAVHIGSQLLKTTPFRRAFGKLAGLVRELKASGVPLSRIDLGGGLGVPYKSEDAAPDYHAYARAIAETVGDLGCRVTLEPGRSLVAAAGLLLTRTIFVKDGLHRRFLIVDAAMNDLVRPAMYEAWHSVVPVAEPAAGAPLTEADIVGPVCETGDTFARLRPMPPVAPGDLLAFLTAGAYGAAMSSTYNSRPLVAEVLVSGDRFETVRRRPSFEDSLTLEAMPDWLSP